ncbi:MULTISPECIES: hypothetical protein [unclassified Streptomyces]|uniref:hypothetical protein n=1 Tax=unclassified Streptomyces TaxID=2593676 RepID=UPI002256F1A2|nr:MULTISPECIES: hypothetical protein [unclassified Streptomyces]MCX5052442.1 hypothetical protein [Streptomyces sp. NBC_00474]MCX5064226.1 hypothetical protein [Streptomyces sp. NBC_00452]MCX5251607.1 hypothetical protein [Streptomyces sp. NBC_00201]MCX5294468.1 hypothetical protein [Streptomyces sp. NBC_00183]
MSAGAFGIAYGVASTPSWWSSLLVVMGSMIAVGCLLGLVGLLLAVLGMDELNRDFGKLDIVAAVCFVLTTWAFCSALHNQALHDHGRAVRAVVVSVHPARDGTGMEVGEMAALSDSSGRRHLGQISAGRLTAGDKVTVTVDPSGKYDVQRGRPPQNPEDSWELAIALTVLQALLCAAIGFSSARYR